jgi:Protein of unknown function (DUF3618)
MTSQPQTDEPIGAVVHRLSEQIPELVRSEIRLAQAELADAGEGDRRRQAGRRSREGEPLMVTQDSGHKPSPAELEADIQRQREQLADTVNELTEQVQVRARTTAKQAAVVAAVLAVVAVAVIVKRRRS